MGKQAASRNQPQGARPPAVRRHEAWKHAARQHLRPQLELLALEHALHELPGCAVAAALGCCCCGSAAHEVAAGQVGWR